MEGGLWGWERGGQGDYGSQKAPRRLSLAVGVPSGLGLGEMGMGIPTRQGAGWAMSRPNCISQPGAGRAGNSSPGAEAVPKGCCDGKH